MDTPEQIREWIADIREVEEDACSEWDIEFLDSIEMRLQNHGSLTDGQVITLKTIYKKAENLDEIRRQRGICTEISEVVEELNEKEQVFIGDMTDRLADNRELTERQLVWMEDIYARLCDTPY